MILTSQQLTTLKNWLTANADGVQDEPAAAMLNAASSPSYWVSSVARADVYDKPSQDATNWDWTIFKNQSVAEQGAWREMFMNDTGRIDLVNWRRGVATIFTGSAPANAQRDHVLSCGRRIATVGEQLFAVAVVSPPANTGNNEGQARGSTANPDNLGAEGKVSVQNISEARNL